MDHHIENSKPDLIHCNGGHGRTGVFVTASMMKSEKNVCGSSFEKSFKVVQKNSTQRWATGSIKEI
mgnify:CR=1 FL=1